MVTPVEIVQRQFDAYNAHDLEGFVASYSDSIKVFRAPSSEPSIAGKAQFSEFYATKRFNIPGLRAALLARMCVGNKVVDHERIWGLGEQTVDIIAAYEITGGLISTMWIFPAE
ncbi:nuclear transport factor 2 family protein [Sorangium sp. So ce1182]|uniref:nuclear transport factor 2 family protein n=1 Tax=Sorangium sp. So ce1182 TaxID=3133334 RepID=UPI003F635AC1